MQGRGEEDLDNYMQDVAHCFVGQRYGRGGEDLNNYLAEHADHCFVGERAKYACADDGKVGVRVRK